jgi:hypothetical protein
MPPPPTVDGVPHVAPLNISKVPDETEPTQYDVDTQETEAKPPLPAFAGLPHEPPLYVTEFPLASTATQNDTGTHETERRRFVPSIVVGEPQEEAV